MTVASRIDAVPTIRAGLPVAALVMAIATLCAVAALAFRPDGRDWREGMFISLLAFGGFIVVYVVFLATMLITHVLPQGTSTVSRLLIVVCSLGLALLVGILLPATAPVAAGAYLAGIGVDRFRTHLAKTTPGQAARRR